MKHTLARAVELERPDVKILNDVERRVKIFDERAPDDVPSPGSPSAFSL